MRTHPHIVLMVPAFVLLIGILAVPVITLVGVSLQESVPVKRYEPGLTLESYERIITDSYYVQQLATTMKLAGLTTVICVALGYPLAYSIWRARGVKKMVLLGAVLLPLFTNIIARIYAWLLIFADEGPISSFLSWTQLGDGASLNFGFWPVLVGVSYVALPYFILILFSTLEGIDWRLVEGAQTLGASKFRSFLEIVVPLSAPGFAGAVAVAFTWGAGAFAEPTILGSPAEWTTAFEASDQLFGVGDWPFAAALSFLLVVATFTFVALSFRLIASRRSLTSV